MNKPMPRLAVLFLSSVLVVACRTTAPPVVLTDQQLDEVRSELTRPVPGNLAALYRLRVPSSGGLRLSVLTLGQEGRATISEPFGAAVSLTAWSEGGRQVVFDLRKQCRFVASSVSGVLEVGALPLPRAVLLLAGRLPALQGDRVEIVGDGGLRVVGDGWQGLVFVAEDPWRVTSVEDRTTGEDKGWRIQLRDHTSSLPGWMKVTGADGRWAELELIRLQWGTIDTLPPMPELPWCPETAFHHPTDRVGRGDKP